MSELFSNFHNFRDCLVSAFSQRQMGLTQQLRDVTGYDSKRVFYPSQFFRLDKFDGSWREIARTGNPLQSDDDHLAVHDFICNGDSIDYTVTQGNKKIQHSVSANTNGKYATLHDVHNNFWSVPQHVNVIGVYDERLIMVTDPSQQNYVYTILGQDNGQAWILARPGFENNARAANHLMRFTDRLGYKMRLTHPELSNSDVNPELDDSSSKKDMKHDVLVVWTKDAFPPDGSGRVLNIPAGKVIRFMSTDDNEHTVAQAIKVDSDTEPSGYTWRPHPDPDIQSPPAEVHFNRTLSIGKEGTYYLVCPVEDHHRIIRLQVNVSSNEDPLSGI